MKQYIRNSDLAWQQYDGETVLVDPAGSICMVLNVPAGIIWQRLEEAGSASEITDLLLAEYDAPREQIEADVSEIIAEFIAKNIIEEV